jgi:tryptophan synthase alpha chain
VANKITAVFASTQRPKLMTHVVAGYPDLATTGKIIRAMAESGADLIEIQIPFSDPLADGPTIMHACEQALTGGITPADCIDLVAELNKQITVPLLIMTYANPVFSMGLANFISRCAKAGVSGLIIPDLPFAEFSRDYVDAAKGHGIDPILLVSPGMRSERLDDLLPLASGFVYATLRAGITGARPGLEPQSFEFLTRVRKRTTLPLAAGFGVSSPEQVRLLGGQVDAVIMGSHLLNLFNSQGIAAVGEFIKSCKQAP